MPNKILKPDAMSTIMRSHFPILGDEFDKYMAVEMLPGDEVRPHCHKRHAVLFYPAAAEAVVIEPQPGTMIYLPPGTLHSVPPVRYGRLSYAMLVSDA